MADATARTEPATPARRDEARRRGDVAASPAVAPAAVVCTALGFGVVAAPMLVVQLRTTMVDWLAAAGPTAIADGAVGPLARRTAAGLAGALGPFLVLVALAGFTVMAAQVGLRPRAPRRKLNAWRQLASIDGLARIVRIVVELALVLVAGGWAVGRVGASALDAGTLPAAGLVALAGQGLRQLGLALAAALVTVAAADYAWARWRHARRLAMSRDEVRDETRRREGDPRVRARVRLAHRAIAGGHARPALASADLVLASPGVVAVALRYRAGEDHAPRVIAAGAAAPITSAARAAGVPVLVRADLARAIERAVPLGGEVPAACYRDVADALASVAARGAGAG